MPQPVQGKNSMIEKQLIEVIRQQFKLDWHGIHGSAHWARVRENGLKLAETTGAKAEVVELFAFLHDSRRLNDHTDPLHGMRAAEFAATLRAQGVIALADADFDLLALACTKHSDGLTVADVTVQTCWDSDRLDLGRVGIQPQARYLCTDAARDPSVIGWAYRRSLRRVSV
jgi:uncharacterized protein